MVTLFTENDLVEQSAIALFNALDWETASCYNEVFNRAPFHGERGNCLGRKTICTVVLEALMRPAIMRLNPYISSEALTLALEELTRDRSVMTLAQANKEIHQLLKNGIKITFSNSKGEQITENVQVIDWNNPENNDFFLASQFWVTGEMYKRRCDLVGFVNGIPLVFIELKASHKKLENAYTGNLKDYKNAIPQLFWYNAFIILSNGSQSRIGALTSDWEHFAEWKYLSEEETLTPAPSPQSIHPVGEG